MKVTFTGGRRLLNYTCTGPYRCFRGGNRRNHCSFTYSALACFRMGMSGSALRLAPALVDENESRMLVTVRGCWLKVRKTGPGIKKASSRVLRALDRVKGPRSTGKVEEVIERVVFGGTAQVPGE